MSLGRYRPWGQSQEKIRAEHRDRAAVVYVRQSSRQQVLEHSESTRLQYALAERAAAVGWARSQIVVIDDDLGVSAATADARAGFARLVTEVTMGRVGIVLGIEMSRLARTGRDWHQLLGAPRGAVYSCGDVRAPPPGRRSGLVKLEAA
jgi:resolvase-like protein